MRSKEKQTPQYLKEINPLIKIGSNRFTRVDVYLNLTDLIKIINKLDFEFKIEKFTRILKDYFQDEVWIYNAPNILTRLSKMGVLSVALQPYPRKYIYSLKKEFKEKEK